MGHQRGVAVRQKFKFQEAWLGAFGFLGVLEFPVLASSFGKYPSGQKESWNKQVERDFSVSRGDSELIESRLKPPQCLLCVRLIPDEHISGFYLYLCVCDCAANNGSVAEVGMIYPGFPFRGPKHLITLSLLCLWSWLLVKMIDKNVLALALTTQFISSSL